MFENLFNRSAQQSQQPAQGNNQGNQNNQQFKQPNNQNNNNQNNNNQSNNNNNNNNNNQNNNQNNDSNNQQQQPGTNDPQNRETPFDAYAKLWDTVDTKADQAPAFDLSDEVVNKSSSALDFMRGMPQEKVNKLRSYFGEAADDVFDLINTVGRQAYATSISHGSKVTGKYLDVRDGFSAKQLDARLRKHTVTQGVSTVEGAKNNPIVRQHMKLVAENLAAQYPDADETWITEQAKKYFVDMASALNPVANQQIKDSEVAKAPGGLEFDWDSFEKSAPKAA